MGRKKTYMFFFQLPILKDLKIMFISFWTYYTTSCVLSTQLYLVGKIGNLYLNALEQVNNNMAHADNSNNLEH